MPRRTEARRTEIERLIEELEESGLSVARFAKEHALSPWTLYEWRRELRGRKSSRARRRFVEVKVTGEAARVDPITVELPSGMKLQVSCGFDDDHLRRLVAALSSC